jgi:hypothetical protein
MEWVVIDTGDTIRVVFSVLSTGQKNPLEFDSQTANSCLRS